MIVSSTLPAFAQSAQTFKLEKGQAMRITPEGKVDVFANMHERWRNAGNLLPKDWRFGSAMMANRVF
jgi:hypothetical protein